MVLGVFNALTRHPPPIAMFILYTVAPLLYRLASSAYFNLSLLSSDFYGLLFGKITSHFSNSPLTRALICATGLFLFVRRAFASYCLQLFLARSLKSTSNHTGSTFLHSQLSSWDSSSTSGTPRVCPLRSIICSSLTIFLAEQGGVNDIRKPSYIAQRGEAVPGVGESEKQAEV